MEFVVVVVVLILLKTILSPVLLCRTKDMKIDGRPLLELPKRNVTYLYATFSPQVLFLPAYTSFFGRLFRQPTHTRIFSSFSFL
jgi:hypothetical protein